MSRKISKISHFYFNYIIIGNFESLRRLCSRRQYRVTRQVLKGLHFVDFDLVVSLSALFCKAATNLAEMGLHVASSNMVELPNQSQQNIVASR